jgi:hypothetical protein
MGILIRNTAFAILAATLIGIIGCSRSTAPFTANQSGLSFEITAAATAITPPQELLIQLNSDGGFHREQNVRNPANNGFVRFDEVPYGHLFVDIQGFNSGNRTLYGHSEIGVMEPQADVGVILRNILTVKKISTELEQHFLPAIPQHSDFWDNQPATGTAKCASALTGTTVLTTILSADQYFYFLFEITDNTFSTEDRPFNQFGEMTSDAVIVYLCKIPPHNIEIGNGTFPAVRFQCEVGKMLDINNRFNFVNLSNNTVRDFSLQTLDNDEVRGRLLRDIGGDPNRRILELRINKGLLSIPMEVQQLGIAIRYRDSFDPDQPPQLCDWQSGQEESNPKIALNSWGYLEVTP